MYQGIIIYNYLILFYIVIILLFFFYIYVYSPGALIAIIFETKAKGPCSSISVGVTVLLDVLVVIIYSIVLAVTNGICGRGGFNSGMTKKS